MTNDDIIAEYDKYDDEEFLKFNRIPPDQRRHERPDLCGMLLLAERFPGKSDMVSSAEHDCIWFDAESDSEGFWPLHASDILYLYRCGVLFELENSSFYAFV